jgi:IMP dehydrogenase
MILHGEDTGCLAFDDVRLIPQLSDIESRAEIKLETKLRNTDIVMRTPVFASPMDKISGPQMANAIWDTSGGIAVIHRYCSIEEQLKMAKAVKVPAAAVGTTGDFLERAQELVHKGVKIICIDVAHGHHLLVKRAIEKIRSISNDFHIMAGNVATIEGYEALNLWGADSVRVGVGTGSICITSVQTGHGKPLWQSIYDIGRYLRGTDRINCAQIIADGGIRQFGDITKSIGAGADFVMMGSMLSGTDEAPGDIIEQDGKRFKSYRGMASKESQIEWRGYHSSNEGIETKVPYKGSVKPILEDLDNALRSGLSYSGARTIKELQERAVFVRVSSASAIEASPHILLQ